MKSIKAFIIHLDRAHDRLAQVDILSSQIPFNTVVLSAIDSQKLDESMIRQFYHKKLYRPYYPFTLSTNEIACFLSHRKAWQYIADENLDAGLILEDDVLPNEQFINAVHFALEHMGPQDFIRFPFREKETGKTLFKQSSFRIIEPVKVGLGQVTQLIGRDAAKQLLKFTEKFDRPVDTTMQIFWKTGIKPLVTLPPCIKEISMQLGGSTIQTKNSFFSRLHHEIMRPIYRLMISTYSKIKKN